MFNPPFGSEGITQRSSRGLLWLLKIVCFTKKFPMTRGYKDVTTTIRVRPNVRKQNRVTKTLKLLEYLGKLIDLSRWVLGGGILFTHRHV